MQAYITFIGGHRFRWNTNEEAGNKQAPHAQHSDALVTDGRADPSLSPATIMKSKIRCDLNKKFFFFYYL